MLLLLFLLLWSYPLVPSLFSSRAESWLSCFVLEQPGFIPVHPCKHSNYTHWIYPYSTLQHTLHIWGLPHYMNNRLMYYLVKSRPSPPYIPSHTPTKILTNITFFYFLFYGPQLESGAGIVTVLWSVTACGMNHPKTILYIYISYGEWVECLSPILGDRGTQTHGFEAWAGQTNDLKMDNCCFLARCSALWG